MKNVSQILNLILAVALVVLAVKVTLLDGDKSKEVAIATSSESMGAIEAIMTRTSVRTYTSQEVSTSDVEVMLKAAMAAPTAGNRQPWSYIVVTDTTLLKGFASIIKGAHMAPKAPMAIVACGEPAKSFPGALSQYWVQDVSAATENLLLAAHSLGLGAVWCGVYPNEANTAKIQELLSLPKGIIPLNIIVVGHPSGTPKIKDKWMPEKVTYRR